MIHKEGIYMIMVSYLGKLTSLVDSKGTDSDTCNNEIKEAYCFIKRWKVKL
jgi:hypothetical protein